MTDIGNNNNQDAGAQAIQPPDPDMAARLLKLSIEESFKDASVDVRQALYAISVANFPSMDKFVSRYAQVVGKIAKVDLAELNRRFKDFPYDSIPETDETVDEVLAKRRVLGEKEVTTLAAIVYEYGGYIVNIGKEVNGVVSPWFRADLEYNGAKYNGEGVSKQLAAYALFNDNEPIRGLAAKRSYAEPTADDPIEKQKANLYFQKLGKAVVVKVERAQDGRWNASGRIDDVKAEVKDLPGKNTAKRVCTYALYNAYKTAKNVPDADYQYIEGAPEAPDNAMQQ